MPYDHDRPAPEAFAAMAPRDCPVRGVLAGLAGKWPVLVVLTLKQGPSGYLALQRAIGDISRRHLTLALRRLERDGLVRCTHLPGKPARSEYALTPLALGLVDQLDALATWALATQPAIEAARQRFDAAQPPPKRQRMNSATAAGTPNSASRMGSSAATE